ncbi:MAG TPA: hypothetical protein VFV07_10130 [Rhizomicrobium sp.]|nr:hypothetical protein [Rhizomicrobium sp.]
MSTPALPRKPELEDTAEHRSDFNKRLFAVAISVGFATTLANMDFVKQGDWPRSDEWQRLLTLATGLFLSVQSWDGYLRSIAEKRLYGAKRFAIDIFLIFTYLFLLLTSAHIHIWLWTIAVIFLIYFIWDILSVREFPECYLPKGRVEKVRTATAGETFEVYWAGFLGKQDYYRGPVITFSWLVYFVLLAAMCHPPGGSCNLLMSCIAFVVFGLWQYRGDKNHVTVEMNDGNETKIFGYDMWKRALYVALGVCGIWLAGIVSPKLCQLMAQCI